MVCNRDGCRTSRSGAALGVPDTEMIQMAARRQRNCPNCGSFLRQDGTCSRCGGQPRGLETRQQRSPAHMTASEYRATFNEDPLRSPALAGMYGRYATNISRQGRRQVVLDESIGTAATDLKGTIMLNPEPLSADASIADQLAVGLGMLEHEILHELYSPCWALEETYDTVVAKGYGRRVGEGAQLDARGQLFTQLFNILEDARIERIAQKEHPGVWRRIWAVHQSRPKDGGYGAPDVLRSLPATDQAVVCLLNDAQPGYSLTPEMWAVLKPEVQAALRDALPHAQRAVTGDARTALDESLAVWDALEQHGMLPSVMPVDWMTSHHGSDSADSDASAGDGESGGHASATKRGPAHCPRCGGFLDAQGVCTKCGHQVPLSQQNGLSQSAAAGQQTADAGGEESGGGAEDDDSSQSAVAGDPDAGEESGTADSSQDSPNSEDTAAGGPDAGANGEKCGDPDGGGKRGVADSSQGAPAGDPGAGASGEVSGDPDGGGKSESGAGAGGSNREGEIPRFLDAPPDAEEQTAARAALNEARLVATSLFDGAEHQATTEREKRDGRVLHDALRIGRRVSMSMTVDEEGKRYPCSAEVYPQPTSDMRAYDNYMNATPDEAADKVQQTQAALPLGKRLGRQLLSLKTKAQATRRFQKAGQLDRGRLIAGSKGSSRIYQRQGSSVGRSIAASISLDTSGSMHNHTRSGELYQAALATAVALQDAGIPFEMTSFSDEVYQIVPFNDPARGPDLHHRIACGTWLSGGNTETNAALMAGALSLLAREEEHKLQFVMTDGIPNSLIDTQMAGDEVRRRGVATIGMVFASEKAVKDETADAMFGRGNWFRLTSLEELPQLAAETIERVIREGERR